MSRKSGNDNFLFLFSLIKHLMSKIIKYLFCTAQLLHSCNFIYLVVVCGFVIDSLSDHIMQFFGHVSSMHVRHCWCKKCKRFWLNECPMTEQIAVNHGVPWNGRFYNDTVFGFISDDGFSLVTMSFWWFFTQISTERENIENERENIEIRSH